MTLSGTDFSRFAVENGITLSPVDVFDLTQSANCDPDEGAEWLPWYKAALGLLTEQLGQMTKWLESGRRPTPEAVAEMKRRWLLHLLLVGIGPSQDAGANVRRKAFSEGEANAAFHVLEFKAAGE